MFVVLKFNWNIKFFLTSLILATNFFTSSSFRFPSQDSSRQIVINGLIKTVNTTLNHVMSVVQDPFVIPVIPIQINGRVLKGIIDIRNMYVTGLSKIFVRDFKVISFSPVQLHVLMNMKNFDINVDYDTDLSFAGIIPLRGRGNTNLNIRDIMFGMWATVDFKKFFVRDLNIRLFVGKCLFNIHGLLFNNSIIRMINNLVNFYMALYLNDILLLWTDILSAVMKAIINAVLRSSIHPKTRSNFING